MRIVIQAAVPIRFRGHFIGGRMVRCLSTRIDPLSTSRRVDCPACGIGIGNQTRWVLAVRQYPFGEDKCWEFSSSVAEQIARISGERTSLRGMYLTVQRMGISVRARLVISGSVDVDLAAEDVGLDPLTELLNILPDCPEL